MKQPASSAASSGHSPGSPLARRFIGAEAPDVLRALTDPQLISVWAPVDFEVCGLRGRHLRGGSHAIVNGSLAGVAAQFEIDVLRADEAGLDLQASGPIDFEVAWGLIFRRAVLSTSKSPTALSPSGEG